MGAVRRHLGRADDGGRGRSDVDLRARVGLEVHRRFLRRHVRPGVRVLEVGAGQARFTVELADIGARVVVTDASGAQLAAHERRLRGTAAESCVLARRVLDVRTDAGGSGHGEFDVVVAYCGPLSRPGDHGADRPADALRALLRIVAPDGVVVASVVSLLGSWRQAPRVPGPAGARSGVRTDAGGRRMFCWSQVVALVAEAGGVLVDGSASNWTAPGDPAALARLAADPDRWQRFLDHETAACAEPGARDGGTHILFAARPA